MELPASSAEVQSTDPSPANPWVDHLGRVSYIRGHISLFAAGSVILLALDLLSGDGDVWADTAIGLWGVLLIVHGILLVIARLLRELLDDERPVRPAAEMRWNAPSTWALPNRPEVTPPTAPASPQRPPDVTAASESPQPESPAASGSDSAHKDQGDRVSWKEATRAAWRAPRDDRPQSAARKDDDPNDFTPLKLD